jgi:hypothetical protein
MTRHGRTQGSEKVVNSSQTPEGRSVVPAQQTRQGVMGYNVRLVLGFSITAVVIVFAIIFGLPISRKIKLDQSIVSLEESCMIVTFRTNPSERAARD